MKKRLIGFIAAITIVSGILPVIPANAYTMGKVGEYQTISAGGIRTAAIRNVRGNLCVWGGNIGNKNPESSMNDVVATSRGSNYTLAIKTDGSLWAWGNNQYLQFGVYVQYSHLPTKIMEDVIAAAAGNTHTAIVQKDGSLWTCGGNSKGQLGDGTRDDKHSYVKIMDDAAAVSAGSTHTAIIKTDGSLWMCGDNSYGQLGDGTRDDRHSPVKIMDDVAAVLAGFNNTMAIKTDGSLWGWGHNHEGQLGDGTRNDQETPVKIMDDVTAVAAGFEHTAVIKTDGSLWTWGSNINGQLGDETNESKDAPVKIMDDVAAVAAGSSHTAVIKTDGSLWTWGRNDSAQLGDGSTKDKNSHVKITNTWLLPSSFETAAGASETNDKPEPTVSEAPETAQPSQTALPEPSDTVLPDPNTAKEQTEIKDGTVISEWAEKEIKEAFNTGIVPEVLNGKNLTERINRAEFAAIAVNLYEKLSGEKAQEAENPFGDINGNDCESDILKAYSLNIAAGTSDTEFEPYALISREQLAAMLLRAYKKSEFEGWSLETDRDFPLNVNNAEKFADDAKISDYAREAVYFMAGSGIIAGVGDNKFAPKNSGESDTSYGYATREQAIVIALRSVKNLKNI